MNPILIIAISSAVSILADTTINICLNKKRRISDIEYQKLLSRVTKDIDYEKTKENYALINSKVDSIEKSAKALYRTSKEVSDLKSAISGLRNDLNDLQSDPEQIKMILDRLTILEHKVNEPRTEASDSVQLAEMLALIDSVVERIEILEQNIFGNTPDMSSNLEKTGVQSLQSQTDYRSGSGIELVKSLEQLNEEVSILNRKAEDYSARIDQIERRFIPFDNHESLCDEISTKPQEHISIEIPKQVVTADAKYIESFKAQLSTIRDILDQTSYNKLENSLSNLDVDEPEDTIESIHSLVEQYIYKCNSKVSSEHWQRLESFLESVGYQSLGIAVGDAYSPVRTYFNTSISATEVGKPDTIKKIQTMPYHLFYYCGSSTDELKLCGKCTYYKK